MVVCAGNGESFEFAKSIGVGTIDSAMSLTRICLQYMPRNLLFIGSAGSYDSKLEIGTLFFSTHATQIEMSFLQNQSYTPIDNSISVELDDFVSHETLIRANISQATVNSSNYITKTSAYNEMMLSANILLENMEAFSVFSVAKYFNIPCLAILCVSNVVCEDSHQQWIRNRALVATRFKEVMQKFHVFLDL